MSAKSKRIFSEQAFFAEPIKGFLSPSGEYRDNKIQLSEENEFRPSENINNYLVQNERRSQTNKYKEHE